MCFKVFLKVIKTVVIIFSCILIFVHPVFSKNLGPLPEVLKPSMIDVFEGDLYVVDSSIIHVYSLSDLKFKRKFGKIGEGPGEYKILPHMAIKMSVLSDSVLVESLDKLTYFTRDGKYLKEIKKPFQLMFIYPIKGQFVARKIMQPQDGEAAFSIISIYNSKMEEVKELCRQKFLQQGGGTAIRFDMGQDFLNFRVCDNKIFIDRSPEGFAIDVFDFNGKKLFQINKKYEKIKLTSSHQKELLEDLKNDSVIQIQMRQQGISWDDLKKQITFDFPDYFPTIQTIEISNNKLYVRTSKMKEKKEEYFIMDLKGNILKKIMIPQFKKPTLMSKVMGVKLSTIRNDRIYYLEENEDEEEWELHVEEIK